MDSSGKNNDGASPRGCNLLHLYLKDVSFEAPRVPGILFGHAQPEVEYDVSNNFTLSVEASAKLGEVFDVTLHVTVRAIAGDQVLFLIDVQQGGLFEVVGYGAEERELVLRTRAPEALYPYVRELVASLVHRAGFPRLRLRPLDFEARYVDAVRQAGAGQEADSP